MAVWRQRGETQKSGAQRGAGAATANAGDHQANGTATLTTLQPNSESRDWLFPGADELYRSIYTAVSADTSDVLAITSAISGEGKTTTALGLAVTAAQDSPDRRVLLVEADFDQPVLAGDFNVVPTPGLVDCLLSDQPIQDAYRTTFLDNLHVVPAGKTMPSAGRLLRSARMPQVLAAMKRSYDLIILDGPAILVNSDSARLCDLANGTVFVVRAGVTPGGLVRQGLDRLDEGKLRGVVLNGRASAVPAWVRRLCGL